MLTNWPPNLEGRILALISIGSFTAAAFLQGGWIAGLTALGSMTGALAGLSGYSNRTPAPATRRNWLLQNAMLCASPLASIVGPG